MKKKTKKTSNSKSNKGGRREPIACTTEECIGTAAVQFNMKTCKCRHDFLTSREEGGSKWIRDQVDAARS